MLPQDQVFQNSAVEKFDLFLDIEPDGFPSLDITRSVDVETDGFPSCIVKADNENEKNKVNLTKILVMLITVLFI